ncbi:EF-hand domain-containing protein [Roseovarius sp. S1116L3]|uniref:EF-hand domain-containing protein n=1 Tax=Roseovarius roseus TaxID=3342636 RepID=UPI00372A7D88
MAQNTSNQGATPPPEGRQGMGHGMKGAMMKMADKDGDGTVSAEERREMMQTRLSENDADGDGSLSRGEFEAMHMKMMQEYLDERFAKLDTDGNGAISSDEMAAHADKMGSMQHGAGHMSQGKKKNQPE